jgi:hypothetical protein
MDKAAYDIVEEPVEESYDGLLNFCAAPAATCSLVVRPDVGAGPAVAAFLDLCRPHLIRSSQCSEWPGTTLIGHAATLHEYAVSSALVRLLSRQCRRLYGWITPNLPEDLAMYRADGSVLLGSIAHERDGWLHVTAEERDVLRARGVALRARAH